jgi:hypothetical protein
VCDITIGEGEAVPPEQTFQKTWRLRNSGSQAWPENCTLNFVQGDRLNAPSFVSVPPLDPGDIVDVSVNMIAPGTPGTYCGSWRLCSNDGSS